MTIGADVDEPFSEELVRVIDMRAAECCSRIRIDNEPDIELEDDDRDDCRE